MARVTTTLNLGAFDNVGSLGNIETIVGNSGSDTITLTAQVSNGSVNLAAGLDALTLGNFTNTVTVSNVETLTGGTAADTVTLGAIASNASIDLSSRQR